MGWKSWSYSERGLVIGAIIGLLISSLYIVSIKVESILYSLLLPFVFPGYAAGLLSYVTITQSMPILYAIGIFVMIISYGLVGALIGFIYGKFQKKKEIKAEGVSK